MTDEELLEKANEVLEDLKNVFGYEPYYDIRVEDHKIIATCPYCGNDVSFETLEDFKVYSEIEDINGKKVLVNACPHCTEARVASKNNPKVGRYLNTLTATMILKGLEEYFNATLILCKHNIFADPFEIVRFKDIKTGEKWDIKLFILMNFFNSGFNSISIYEDNIDWLNARDTFGNNKKISSFLLNPEDDVYLGLADEEVPEEVEESNQEENENIESEEKEDENTEIVENNESKEENTEIVSSENENENSLKVDDDSKSTEETVEEKDDENEITESDLKEEEEEVIDDEPIEKEKIEEPEPVEQVEETKSEEIIEPIEDVVEEKEEVEKINTEESLDEDEEIVDDDRSDSNNKLKEEIDGAEKSSEPEIIESSVEEDDENEITESDLKEEEEEEVIDDEPIEKEKIEEPVEEKEEVQSTESNNDNTYFGFSKPKVVLDLSNNTVIEEEPVEEKEEVQSTESNNDNTYFGFSKPKVVLDLNTNEKEERNPFWNSSEEDKSQEISEENSVEVVEDDRPHSDSNSIEEDTENNPEIEEIEDENGPTVVLDLSNSTVKNNTKKEKRYNKTIVEKLREDETDFVRRDSNKLRQEDNDKWYSKCIEFDENDPSFNEFVDEIDLHKEFLDSEMGMCIKGIYEKTVDHGVESSLIINEDTFEIPIVDFNTGVRLICIDSNNINQMAVSIGYAEQNVKFTYPLKDNKRYERAYLYSDMLSTKERAKATIRNLVKIVDREKFDPRRKRMLGGNYTLYYTDDVKIIRDFEATNSSYPYGKPSTKSIGLIALRNKSGVKSDFSMKDMLNWATKTYKFELKSFNLYMVASARYIVKVDHANKNVNYIITDYTELSTTILVDGLDRIIGGIIKEHLANNTVTDRKNVGGDYSSYSYSFEFEFDPASLISPSLEVWCDNSGFIPNLASRYEDGQGCCYIRKPENRTSITDSFRIDPRYFSPATFAKKFSMEIAKANINILHEPTRLKFIERLGFVSCYYPRTKKFILNYAEILKLAMDPTTMLMQKIDVEKFFSGSGVYDGGYDNLLMQKFFLSKLNNSDMDENTRNMMNFIMMSNMIGK